MDFLRRLVGTRAEADDQLAAADDDRQAVTVLLRLSDPELLNEREQLHIFGLEDRLMKTLDESGAGTHETNELEGGYLRIQLLGPDADRIAQLVRPHLAAAPAGSYLAIRRGPAGASEERLDLHAEEEQ
ncbi:MAG TPA: hypothetical protein VMP67_00445 [Candidatus Limnocylindria bacterium]|nr:hypothetical protein [Candidatus Limnocylindria bacterium]